MFSVTGHCDLLFSVNVWFFFFIVWLVMVTCLNKDSPLLSFLPYLTGIPSPSKGLKSGTKSSRSRMCSSKGRKRLK